MRRRRFGSPPNLTFAISSATMDLRATLSPRPTRAVQRLNQLLAPLGSDVPDVSFEAFARNAERATRLDDWGDGAAVARFRRAARAVEDNPHLSPWGRISLRIYLQSKFVNHLLRVDFVKRHPEVREVPVEAPLIIFGWYRTGTTLLHNLLSANEAHRAPRAYELCFPTPFVAHPGRDEKLRRAATSFVLNANRFVVPEQASAHHVEVDYPEECFFLFENSGVSTTLFNTYHAREYAFDLLREDMRPVYEDHKLQLQILSLARPRRRWVLKCPYHLFHLEALADVYPDARVVHTHRHACKALVSNCSLSAITTSKFVNHLDLRSHGRFWSDLYRVGIDRGLAGRARFAPGRLADVRTDELARDPAGTVESLYRQLGLDFSDDTRQRLQLETARQQKDSRGAHVYHASDFGLDDAEIAARFADYHARFGLDAGVTSQAPGSTRPSRPSS